jgi:hypothetical protein
MVLEKMGEEENGEEETNFGYRERVFIYYYYYFFKETTQIL